MAVVRVGDEDDLVCATQQALNLARLIALPLSLQVRLALVVTELSTNLIRHAGGGWLNLFHDGSSITVEVTDSGPGIRSCLGTGGLGLGVVQRQAREFTIRTSSRNGTYIRAVVG